MTRSARSPCPRRTVAPRIGIRLLTCSCGPQTLIGEAFVGCQPQPIAKQRLRFLNSVHALRTNDEAGVHIWVVRERAAAVSGESAGVPAALAPLGPACQQRGR